MAELRIRELAADAAGRRRVEVSWQDGVARRLAVNEIDGLPGTGDAERIRWYLEDYAEFPAHPAPEIARDADAAPPAAPTCRSLPWYFASLFATTYGAEGEPAAERATSAYMIAIGALGGYYMEQAEVGAAARVVPVLRAEEENLLHALNLARTSGLWTAATGCTAIKLLTVLADRHREKIAGTLTAPVTTLTPTQRNEIRTLGAIVNDIGRMLARRGDPGCLSQLQEALALTPKIGDHAAGALAALPRG